MLLVVYFSLVRRYTLVCSYKYVLSGRESQVSELAGGLASYPPT